MTCINFKWERKQTWSSGIDSDPGRCNTWNIARSSCLIMASITSWCWWLDFDDSPNLGLLNPSPTPIKCIAIWGENADINKALKLPSILGLEAMFACLHYADVEEQMRQFKKLKHLSILYPDVYGSLLDLWSIQTVEGGTHTGAAGGQPGGMYQFQIFQELQNNLRPIKWRRNGYFESPRRASNFLYFIIRCLINFYLMFFMVRFLLILGGFLKEVTL